MPRESAMALVSDVGRRLRVRAVLLAIAWGSAAALTIAVLGRLADLPRAPGAISGTVVVTIAVVVTIRVARWWRSGSPAQAARAIERHHHDARNLVITAEELARHPERAAPWIRERVLRDATEAVASVRASDVVPFSRFVTPIVVTLASLLAAVTIAGWSVPVRLIAPIAESANRLLRPESPATITVTVHPPSYTVLDSQVLRDPERIDVLEGSRLTFETRADADVRFGQRPLSGDVPEWIARDSGYFAIETATGERRLVALSVRTDRAPVVKIRSPGKDLLLPDGRRSIPITVTATDDLGLASLELRYTKVTGSGEQFEFVEGALPVQLERQTDREWRASASLALTPLGLQPGDSLVYRAVSRDRRPGDAGLGTSDTYFVEIAGPGQIALEGVEMPPELERYAMSQQMIVLKLEQLRSREASMSRDALVEEAAGLAAEQRTVRANFIFLLGGHVEDEEEEAEQSHEIQEGRLENTARRDINAAIGHMTRAEQGMTAVNTGAALRPARAAVESLQRAFGRSRYLLRSLAVRSRLDLSRRLTGDIRGASDWRRPASVFDEADPRHRAADLLDALIRLAAAPSPSASALHQAAEAALSLDPAASRWQNVSSELVRAAQRTDDALAAMAHLERAIAAVRSELQRAALPRLAPPPSTPLLRAHRARENR